MTPTCFPYLASTSINHAGHAYDSDPDTSFDPVSAIPAAPARSIPWSAGRVVDSNWGESDYGDRTTATISAADTDNHPIAPSVITWARNCFAGGLTARPDELSALIQEASDAARNDFDEASARAWAHDYRFPPDMLTSDAGLLRAHQLDFKAMIRRRLTSLAPDRLNPCRVDMIRDDNCGRSRGLTPLRPILVWHS